MSETKRVTKAAGVVGGLTFISRILGYVRDMVVAAFFGAGFFSDAFIAAFRIPNLLRRLFAEGTLTIAFIPVFTEYLTKEGEDQAFAMARSALKFLSMLLVIISVIGIFMSPLIVHMVAPGFADIHDKFELTVLLTKIVFPYLFFICMVALCMGILNALGHFAAPAIAPVFLNVGMIATIGIASFFTDDQKTLVIWLAIGVLVGGCLQLVIQIPPLVKRGIQFWKKSVFLHPGMKRVGVLMLPAIVGAGVYQINQVIISLLSSLLPEGSMSYLYYADRLVQFPLGIFAIAIGTAVLPSLSRQASNEDYDGLKETFSYAMKLNFFIMVPSMVGLIVLREPIVALLFQRGEFDINATKQTADALLYYSLGLWAIASSRVVVPTFYALQDTKTPVKIAVISIIANIMLGIILMQNLLHRGLALALSISAVINLCLLIILLRKRIGHLGGKNLLISLIKTITGSILMGAAVWRASLYIIPKGEGTMLGLLIGIILCIGSGIVIYTGVSFLTKSAELESVLDMIRAGGKKK